MATTKPTTQSLARTIGAVTAFTEALQGATEDPYMTIPQVLLLLQLHVHGQVMQQDLPKFTKVAKSANSRNVAKLGQGEKPAVAPGLGLVEAFEDLTDRRTKIVRLTPKGRAVLDMAASKAAHFMVPSTS